MRENPRSVLLPAIELQDIVGLKRAQTNMRCAGFCSPPTDPCEGRYASGFQTFTMQHFRGSPFTGLSSMFVNVTMLSCVPVVARYSP